MAELGKLAAPGEWAMNDRFDGTALDVRDLGRPRRWPGTTTRHCCRRTRYCWRHRFRDYPTDPAVRAAVQRLNIHWVILGSRPPSRASLISPG